MVGMVKKQSSHWWWFDNQNTLNRSPWLQSTLAELDHKTEAMLKLIEADADSFAQRAEMYYKKRPELISMVEEFYRSHRSLAEKYDQVKSDSGTRVLTTLRSPFSSTKYQLEKLTSRMTDQTYDSYSEKSTSRMTDLNYDSYSDTCDVDDSAESEVDDPEVEDNEQECQTPTHEQPKEERVFSGIDYEELRKLREEVERLQEENRAQKDQLKQKDEEKIEVIRQLSLAVDVLKEENVKLRKCLAKDIPKRQSPFEFNKLKESFWGKMFKNVSQKYHIVAL